VRPADWTDLDRRHVWHPYTQMLTAPPPVPIERAEGVYLYTPDGRRILDGISSWWVNIHGHSHPRLLAALEWQAKQLQQVVFAGFTHEPAARLAGRLVELAPRGLERVFFSDDGSTAVEVALKLAVQYWHNRGERGRDLFVALARAYHGDTFGAMAAGGVLPFAEAFRPLLFQVRRAHAPCCYDPSWDDRGTTATLRCRDGCDGSLEEVLEREGGRVAAVIVEPMLQGAGGMLVWPAGFLRRVRELCDRHGVLLIADEVFTGCGRTGRLFACEHGPVRPDLLCLSKALAGGVLPLATTLATEEVYGAFLSSDRSRTFFHGHSYTANALACAVALESITLLVEEEAIERVAVLERLFAARLARLRRLPAVEEVRGIGAVAAVELKEPQAGDGGAGGYLHELGPRLRDEFLRRDILLRPLGNVVYFAPPYVITDGEAHRVFDAIEEVVGAVGDGSMSGLADRAGGRARRPPGAR
jgi:adenosylmethionine-8-amino-7-oxononanoate aminotransferase